MLSAHDDSAENLWLTKHVVVGSRLIRDAGSTPAASTSLRSRLAENEGCPAVAPQARANQQPVLRLEALKNNGGAPP